MKPRFFARKETSGNDEQPASRQSAESHMMKGTASHVGLERSEKQ
jgi:hypothetical protein